MPYKDEHSKPPTASEVELAADWARTSRLIEESILSRLDFDPKEVTDPRDRYAPLKWLLNDSYVSYIHFQDNAIAAREYRRKRQQKYSQLLEQLRTDLNKSFSDRIGDIERSGCWRQYAATAADAFRAQSSLGLLRAAYFLHRLHLPGPKDIANFACDLVKYSALAVPPQSRVVPIR